VSLSSFALRYKAILVVVVGLLMVWGVLSYLTMPRRENPEFVIRVCLVQTSWPGAPAERVEELITAPLEAEINTLDGLRWVRSQTVVGRSSVFVELDRPTVEDEVAQMWDQVRARVDRVPMPESGIKPVVFDDFGDEAIMLLTLYQTPMPGQTEIREQDRYSYRDLEIFATRLQDELRIVEGIAKVDLAGVRNEAIYVETDVATWSQLALTTDDLGGLLEARNVLAPGGTIDTRHGRFSVKPSGDIDAVKELDAVVVGMSGEGSSKTPVYIDNLGLNVVRGYQDPPAQIARHTQAGFSAPCVEVSMTMKDGSNVIATSDLVKAKIRELQEVTRIFPPDIGITPIIDAAETVDAKLKDFVSNVVGAIVIVIAIAYLMVGFRSSSVMAANIPFVIIGSLALITLFGVQLEQISLAAMIIALGMLVDNAVQICDQCRRLQSEGLPRFKAAVEGANQLSFPMFIATMTTVMAFFPMLLGLQGSQKEYVQSLPITISVVLLLSWVMAMTFCVLLAYWLIRAPKDPEASLSPVIQLLRWLRRNKPAKPKKEGPSLYYRLSMATLKARWLVVAVSIAALVAASMLPVASEFFPEDERNAFAVEVWLPEGATIEQANAATKRVEELVMKLSPAKDAKGQPVERVHAMRTMVGGGGGRWYLSRDPEALKPNYAELLVRTTDGKFTSNLAQEVRRIAREGDDRLGIAPIEGVRVIPREMIMGPGVPAPVAIRIFAPRLGAGFADPYVLKREAAKVKDILRKQEGVWDIYDTWGSSAYQLDVEIDPDKANLAGVTNASIAQTLNAYYSGHLLTSFREEDHVVPVYLRLPPEQRGDFEGLSRSHVEGRSGKVPLDAVATLRPAWKLGMIERRYQLRLIEVRGRNEGTQEFKEWEENLPPGYWWEVGGDLYESKLSQADLQISLVISLLSIILLLVIQYNGVTKPLIIIATLPLALIGAMLGLYLTGNAMGFMPQLGLLSLFGVVVNAAIIFLEFADIMIVDKIKASDGSGPIMGITVAEFRDCLARAGEVRLLPIAMTTLTTIGGLIPLALAGGPLWEGMAWLMIFGLTIATVLTLVVVPALFAIFVENFKIKPVAIEAE
jgi:multidrug efflux pump subunit AcrB